MGRELQKKKKRSSIAKIKMKPKSKRVNPLGNPIIAANWYGNSLPRIFNTIPSSIRRTNIRFYRNQDETLTQNYRRLGLTSRLNTATGGVEKLRPGETSKTSTASRLAISNAFPKTFAPLEATVERDPETGKILRVIHPKTKPNPLNDPLNSDSEDGEEDSADGEVFKGFDSEKNKEKRNQPQNEIIRQLEEQAASGKEKTERKQSEREREWIESLVGRHGENYSAMVRDKRLNPMQQTEADIRRRVVKWKVDRGSVGVNA